jgi:hypothetical protein
VKAEPAAGADDTDQAPAELEKKPPGKKQGVRRRPVRAKQAATTAAPATTAPVKRKLINEL